MEKCQLLEPKRRSVQKPTTPPRQKQHTWFEMRRKRGTCVLAGLFTGICMGGSHFGGERISIGDDDVATAKRNIALARSKYEGDNTEELLNANQELYELRVGDEYTIDAGKNYVIRLQKADRGDEARELLKKVTCHKQASPWSSSQYYQEC